MIGGSRPRQQPNGLITNSNIQGYSLETDQGVISNTYVYYVNACSRMESTPSCLSSQCDVLPVVFLLSDMEDCLFLERQPYHLFGLVFSELWNRAPPTPLFQLHSIPGGPYVSCSGLGQALLTNSYGHQVLLGWVSGFFSFVGQVIPS